MTAEQYRLLQGYVDGLSRMLGLKDWSVNVSDQAPEDTEATAETCPTEGRKHATISLCSGFASLSPEEVRETLVHELPHLHHAAATDVIRIDLWESRAVSHATYATIFGAMRRQMEYAVDGVARAISGFFPLPDWRFGDGRQEQERGKAEVSEALESGDSGG